MGIFTKKEPVKKEPAVKEVKETKCTCASCQNIWYYGKLEASQQSANKMSNLSKNLMCCGGCLPALLIQDKAVIDLDKCPKCGSKAVKKEIVTHHV